MRDWRSCVTVCFGRPGLCPVMGTCSLCQPLTCQLLKRSSCQTDVAGKLKLFSHSKLTILDTFTLFLNRSTSCSHVSLLLCVYGADTSLCFLLKVYFQGTCDDDKPCCYRRPFCLCVCLSVCLSHLWSVLLLKHISHCIIERCFWFLDVNFVDLSVGVHPEWIHWREVRPVESENLTNNLQ